MNPDIRLIAIDLDGTLLNSQHAISARTEQTLKRATAAGIQVVIATGRPRRTSEPFLRQLGLNTPGVFLQGLAVCNADGSVRHEQFLDVETARRTIQFAEERNLTLMAYNAEKIITRRRNAYTEILSSYYEPLPDENGSMQDLPGKIPICKLLFVNDPAQMPELRAQVSARLGDKASLVLSRPEFLEVLPSGASKSGGLKRLLADEGIDPQHVLALGDGENDIEMIALAGIGVAMANATEHLKAIANHITASNDDDGVALAVERFVLG